MSTADHAPSADGKQLPQPNGAGHAETEHQDKFDQLFNAQREWQEKIEARIGDMGRSIAKFKGIERALAPKETDTTQSQQATPQGFTAADWRALRSLDRAMEGLPDLARDHLEQLEANGASPSDMLREAKAIRLGMGVGATPAESGAATAPSPRTKERPATAPSRTSVQHPRSLSQYYELARSNPEAKKQLDKDPTFHPEDLPHRE